MPEYISNNGKWTLKDLVGEQAKKPEKTQAKDEPVKLVAVTQPKAKKKRKK